MNSLSWLSRSTSSLILTLLLVTAGAALAAQFERPPTLPAEDLVSGSLLSGEGFHVNEQVPTDGLMAHFTIQSDVGTFPANSIEMLRIRVAEIPAIQQLTKTSKTQVFAQSLAENAQRPIQAAGQMVMNPVETIQGLPAGVGRFFGRVGLGAQKIEEAATPPESNGQGLEAAGQATRDAFGYEQERRGLAKKLHVDPYTTNPVLSKQLDDFALTAFRAHVAVTTSMSVFIPGSMAITATRMVSQWVWDTPKADLILQNQQGLQALGVSAAQIKAFESNPVFPLSVQTAFVANLGSLPGVPGRAQAVALASTARSEVQARFLTYSIGMLARYHQTQTRLPDCSFGKRSSVKIATARSWRKRRLTMCHGSRMCHISPIVPIYAPAVALSGSPGSSLRLRKRISKLWVGWFTRRLIQHQPCKLPEPDHLL
jgi:hypothetical protein